jgi:protein TonB
MTVGSAADGTVTRALGPAFAASIALHAALLAGVPDFWTLPAQSAPPPLMAWLVPGGPPAAAPEVAMIEPPRSAATPPRPHAAPKAAPHAAARPATRSTAMPEAASAAQPAPDRDRAAPAAIDAPPAPQMAAAQPAAVAVASPAGPAAGADPVPAPASGSPAQSAEPGQASLELGPLAQYRLALIGAAKQHKRYPPRAIDLGWEGRVDVRLVVGPDGALARLLVQRSSGHDLLDRQALELMRTASALTPVPPALRDREFAVEVPVLYELKDVR